MPRIAPRALRPPATLSTVLFSLETAPRRTGFPRSFIFLNLGSLRAETSEPRSDPEDRGIRCMRTPFVSGAGPLGAGIYDGGGVRMRRDRADQPNRVRNRSGCSRNAPDFCSTAPRRKRFPRPFTKRTRATVSRRRYRLRARSKSANIGVIDVRNPR